MILVMEISSIEGDGKFYFDTKFLYPHYMLMLTNTVDNDIHNFDFSTSFFLFLQNNFD